MRRPPVCIFALLLSLPLAAQAPAPPQSPRQALIEMFFGSTPNHLEKHLPDATRNTLTKMASGNGVNTIAAFDMIASQAKANGAKLETFDTGPILFQAEDPRTGGKVEITVERDDLSGDEDQIELALHMTKDGKEQSLPFTPRFTFTMKSESDVWRLNEISVTVRLPLADPAFLKSIEERQRGQNEQAATWKLQTIINAENSYHAVHGTYACTLSDLRRVSRESNDGKSATVDMLSGDLASGKSAGYIFAISGCDGGRYEIAAEPATPDSGQRAFCSDESGKVRAATNGKATACISSGTPVPNPAGAFTGAAPAIGVATAQQSAGTVAIAQRVRVSQGVSNALIISKVPPVYPPEARAEKIEGDVLVRVRISKTGDVLEVNLISGHPLLAAAAIDAVKQWKYKPYLLNGNPVEVETQAKVNFTLSAN
jgi:TonB family protein